MVVVWTASALTMARTSLDKKILIKNAFWARSPPTMTDLIKNDDVALIGTETNAQSSYNKGPRPATDKSKPRQNALLQFILTS